MTTNGETVFMTGRAISRCIGMLFSSWDARRRSSFGPAQR